VERTGMRAEVWCDDAPAVVEARWWQRWGRTVLTAASGLLTLAGFVTHALIAGSIRAALGSQAVGAGHHIPAAARLRSGRPCVAGACPVAPRAWSARRRPRPDMTLLMLIAGDGAVGINEWFGGATVAFLSALPLALEAWSVGRARRAVEALLDL